MYRIMFLAVLFLVMAVEATASIFSADAVAVDNVRHPVEGFGPVSTSASVFGFPIDRFSPAGTAAADSFATASSAPSGLRLSALHFLEVAGAKSGSRGQSTQTYAAWDLDDFVITGPGLSPIPASLNLFISGELGGNGLSDGQGSLTTFAVGGGNFFIHIELNGAVAGNGSADSVWSNGTMIHSATDLLEGRIAGGAVHTIITTDQLMLPVGQVFRVEVETFADARGSVTIMGTPADEFDSVTASGGGFSSFQQTVSFPTSGPVFNLPEGYTLNSLDARIVNNRFVSAVPEAGAIVGWSGLALATVATQLWRIRRLSTRSA